MSLIGAIVETASKKGVVIDKIRALRTVDTRWPSGKGGFIDLTNQIAVDYYLIEEWEGTKVIKIECSHVIRITQLT